MCVVCVVCVCVLCVCVVCVCVCVWCVCVCVVCVCVCVLCVCVCIIPCISIGRIRVLLRLGVPCNHVNESFTATKERVNLGQTR